MFSKSQLGSVLIAVLLVGSMLAPIVGPATAAPTPDEAGEIEATDPVLPGPGLLVPPWFGNETADEFDREQAEFADKLDAYEQGQKLKADIRTQTDILRNNYYDAQDQAWKDAEEAFLSAYIDGANESAATQAGLDAMRDHYETRQKNLIEVQNNIILDIYTIQNEVSSFSMPANPEDMGYKMHTHKWYPGMEFEVNNIGYSQTSYWTPPDELTVDINTSKSTTQDSLSLANGESKGILSLPLVTRGWTYDEDLAKWKVGVSGNGNKLPNGTYSYNLLDGQMRVESSNSYTIYADLSKVQANLYPDAYPSATAKTAGILDLDEFSSLWSDYQTTVSEDTSEFETWANASYGKLDNGTVDPEDLLNKFSLMEQQSDIDHENATFSEAVAALAADGLSTPAGSTGYINISYQTGYGEPIQTTEGMLFSQTAPPNESWQVDHTYNSTDLGGAQIVVGLDGNMDTIEGDFRVNGAFDRNGTEIQNPVIESPERTYQTSNVSELRDEIVNLSNQVAELKNETIAQPGGGGAVEWPDLGIPNPIPDLGDLGQWVGLAGAAFAVLLLIILLK